MTTDEAVRHPLDGMSGPPSRLVLPMETYLGMAGDMPVHVPGWDKPVDGRRVLVSLSTGYAELVCVGEAFDDPMSGDRGVRVALEDEFWRWRIASQDGRLYYEDAARQTVPIGRWPRRTRVVPTWAVYVLV